MKDAKAIRGDRVRARRAELGWSQRELANRMGVRQQSLGDIENGETKRPRRLLELSEALQVSQEWLLGLTDDPTQQPPDARLRSIVDQIEDDDKDAAIRLLVAWLASRA